MKIKAVKCIKDVAMNGEVVFTLGEIYPAQVFDDSIQALNNQCEMHVIKANTLGDFFEEYFELL